MFKVTAEMKYFKMLVMCLGVIIGIMSSNVAFAADYRVGGSNGGWDQFTDLPAWASSQSFFEGDNLVFQYTRNHDVTEVSRADFDSCTSTNPLQPPQSGGNTVIALTSSGSRYFICTRHCRGGMRVQIDTLAASVQSPSPIAITLPQPL